MRIALVALALVACGRHHDAPAPSPPPPVPPDATPKPPPHVDEGLLGELGREAAARTGARPTVEEVLGALEGGGVAILRKQQVLATPIGARYCTAAVSRIGLNMSICEFETAAAAEVGRARSLALFKAIQRRTLLINGRTLLTLIVPQADAGIEAQRDRAAQRFAALSASPR